MTTILDIKKDIEYVNTQIIYLETYIQKIKNVLSKLKSFRKYWSGPSQQELVYKEITGWLSNYSKLKKHMESKVIHDVEVNRMMSELPNLEFVKPSTYQEDHLIGFKSIAYQVFPPFRISYNSKKVKQIVEQVNDFETALLKMKSISFKIEGYYMDGV
jgi:hypothetical protein